VNKSADNIIIYYILYSVYDYIEHNTYTQKYKNGNIIKFHTTLKM